jgi:transcriptional regulator with XRE-family HTH domain
MGTMSERIAAKRRDLGISQTELAKRVGCSRQTVNMWERGHVHDLSGPHLRALAEIFKVEPAWIVSGGRSRGATGAMDEAISDPELYRRIHLLTPEERDEVLALLDKLDRKQRELYEELKRRFENEEAPT